MPYGCDVVAVKGRLLGVRGRVIGPHTDSSDKNMRKPLKDKSSGTGAVKSVQTVDIEFSVLPPESPFGHAITEVIIILILLLLYFHIEYSFNMIYYIYYTHFISYIIFIILILYHILYLL